MKSVKMVCMSSADFFFKINFFTKILSGEPHLVGHDLDPNLFAVFTNRQDCREIVNVRLGMN